MSTYSLRFTGFELITAACIQEIEAIERNINVAVAKVAEITNVAWQAKIITSTLRKSEKEEYLNSLSWHFVGNARAVVESDYSQAEKIEFGRPSRDLKDMLQTSNKVRVVQHGKNAGKKYLIIPMQHNTPGSTAHAKDMPKAVYKKAKYLDASRVTGQTTRVSGTGAIIHQLTYKWGGRLGDKHGNYSGMVKIDTSTPPTSTSNGSKSSKYLTFRCMMEGQSGWVVHSIKGRFIAMKTLVYAQKQLNSFVEKAISSGWVE